MCAILGVTLSNGFSSSDGSFHLSRRAMENKIFTIILAAISLSVHSRVGSLRGRCSLRCNIRPLLLPRPSAALASEAGSADLLQCQHVVRGADHQYV